MAEVNPASAETGCAPQPPEEATSGEPAVGVPMINADLDDWHERWSERADQVAYRLTLIDAQFEELLRIRENQTPASPDPVATQRAPIVSPLLSEL